MSNKYILQTIEYNKSQEYFALELDDSEFSVALDKGTLDALMVDNSETVVSDVQRMFDEIDRVVRLMGRYICISLLQEHILHLVLKVFSEKGWALRIHTEESGNSDRDFHMPVFALVFTKFKKNPNFPQVLEVCSDGEKIERFPNIEALVGVVKEMQYYAVIRQRISKKIPIEDIPVITVIRQRNIWISLDNRRLWVFKHLQRHGKCGDIPVNVQSDWRRNEDRILTSRNVWIEIKVRGDPGGRWHNSRTVGEQVVMIFYWLLALGWLFFMVAKAPTHH